MPKPKPDADQLAAARDDLERRLGRLAPRCRVMEVLRVGAGSRPNVAVVIVDGRECVVKDHEGCDRWFAKLIGPLLTRREIRALERLASVEGVPRVVRVFDRRAFAMSRLDAEPYRGHQLALDEWRAFFEDMRRLVEAMHSRGVAHCDLRSPDNTLITSSGKPAVVDFVASYTRGSALKPWSRWLFAKLCAVDRSAVDKQIRTVCPELLSPGTGAVREAESVLDRFGRRLGVAVRNLARRLFTDR